ncbi:ubiquinone/menaquinone biosynthesis C-methylase UbiE [Limibacillus sp. MBR-115]|jgi:ubiquinone/menaquinone biosynthesis C-methylase UbiE
MFYATKITVLDLSPFGKDKELMPESSSSDVAAHYSHGDLEEGFRRALAELGFDGQSPSPVDLAPVDEFHIGGLDATLKLADRLNILAGQRWLDVGAGVGGPARAIAQQKSCHITGIDLVGDFVRVAETLNRVTKLTDAVEMHCGSALDMPFQADSFDGGYMLHVGMNIADKAALFREVARVLKPGAAFGVYDVMRVGTADISYPVPWASHARISFLAKPEEYRLALKAAGLNVVAEHERTAEALAFFERMAEESKGKLPRSLGAHVVMGKTAPEKIGNLRAGLSGGAVTPVEIITRKAM